MNQESLDRANALLAAFAARAEPGELSGISPAELGKEIGMTEPLAAARAVRALLARRRLEAVDGRYRLLDARPIEPGERETVPRVRRPKKPAARKAERRAASGRPTYNELGREAVDRLIELGREVATLRAGLRSAREDAPVSSKREPRWPRATCAPSSPPPRAPVATSPWGTTRWRRSSAC
jgi:hypothetical protein